MIFNTAETVNARPAQRITCDDDTTAAKVVRKLPAPKADTFTALMNVRVTSRLFADLALSASQALALIGPATRVTRWIPTCSTRIAGVLYKTIEGLQYAQCEVMEGGWFDSEHTGHTYVTSDALDDLRHKVWSERRNYKQAYASPVERNAATWGDADRILSFTVSLLVLTTRVTQAVLAATVARIETLRIRITAMLMKPAHGYPTTDRRVRVWPGSQFKPRY